jgi:hypothetical protein
VAADIHGMGNDRERLYKFDVYSKMRGYSTNSQISEG